MLREHYFSFLGQMMAKSGISMALYVDAEILIQTIALQYSEHRSVVDYIYVDAEIPIQTIAVTVNNAAITQA